MTDSIASYLACRLTKKELIVLALKYGLTSVGCRLTYKEIASYFETDIKSIQLCHKNAISKLNSKTFKSLLNET
jgi:hypothetical protein